MEPKLILINPWIYDFAAYDLWSKPLGLLYLAGLLRSRGFEVHLLDCLDVYHPEMQDSPSMSPPLRRPYGTGKFWRKMVANPPPLKHVPRSYSRYGISRQLFIKELQSIEDPAAILVTSLMTYWYPGVQEVISIAKEAHPNAPVILGGIYARLCKEHALQHSGADYVASEGDPNDPSFILEIMDHFNIPASKQSPDDGALPYPAFDRLRRIDYVCLLTSTGCPYRCQYCASYFLNPTFYQRDPFHVLEEILYWHGNYGVKDFAFYDDALLLQSDTHMAILLEKLISLDLNLRFHTPNALHVRGITHDMARLLHTSGFRTIRLGLETSDMELHRDLGKKLSEGEFERAVYHLRKAGFSSEQIGVYILMGLPEQSVESVAETTDFVGRTGAMPYLAEYSPIPQTPMWEMAQAHSDYELSSEPLFHNNTLLPCWDDDKRAKVPDLKKQVLEIRRSRT
ncbi:MAG: B12-binding domain-containing radical SAM protein [Desulfobacteraceae bacterium]